MSNRKYFFSANTNRYKANLHCHSTFSDGRLTPEQLKEAYMKRGYSIIAYSDHEMLFPHNELSDESFLSITSYEYAVNDTSGTWEYSKCYHLNLFSKDKDMDKIIYYRPNFVNRFIKRCGLGDDYVPAHVGGEFEDMPYSQEAINEFIKLAHENGFLVSVNHPAWSLQTFHDYDRLEGFDMLEMTNYECEFCGFLEDSNHIFDRMLRNGQTPFPISTDDNHNCNPIDGDECACFGGFTIICAPELTYDAVMKSIENGDMYSSSGPLFDEVYFEDGKVYVKCSPVRYIRLLNEGRDAPFAVAPEGELLTEAVFDVDPAFCGKYVRVDIRDDSGAFANTKAMFTKDLFEGTK